MFCDDCAFAQRQKGGPETEELTECTFEGDTSDVASLVAEDLHLFTAYVNGVPMTPTAAQQDEYLLREMGVGFACPYGSDTQGDERVDGERPQLEVLTFGELYYV
jgi:hypothetical protein